MAEIKTVLTAPKIRGLAVCDGGGYQDDKTAHWEFSDDGLQKLARAIEAAVLSANAGTVDAVSMQSVGYVSGSILKRALRVRGGSVEMWINKFDDTDVELFAAPSPTQQAIDAGKV